MTNMYELNPDYLIPLEEHINKAKEIIKEAKKVSGTLLQRTMGISWARACMILDKLEENGLVGPQIGAKPRDIYIDKF